METPGDNSQIKSAEPAAVRKDPRKMSPQEVRAFIEDNRRAFDRIGTRHAWAMLIMLLVFLATLESDSGLAVFAMYVAGTLALCFMFSALLAEYYAWTHRVMLARLDEHYRRS